MSRKKLTDNGWKRHSIIESDSSLGNRIRETVREITEELFKIDSSIIIVTTYDCAVINDDFGQEPWLQVLIAVPVSKKKAFENGRNPRKIHIEVDASDTSISYEVTAKSLFQIERQLILNDKPSPKYLLNETNSHILKIWMAERFRKDTWSDEFEAALRPATSKLKKFFKKYSSYVSGVYIYCKDEKLEPFDVKAIIAIPDEKMRSLVKAVKEAENNQEMVIDDVYKVLSNQLKNAFGETVRIIEDTTVSSNLAIDVKSESGLSLADIRNYKLFSPYEHSELNRSDPYPVDTTNH